MKAARHDLGSRGYIDIVESIDGLIQLCLLLMEPENHIKVRSGQFVERQVYTRTASDMKEDMVQELTRLYRFEAWAKTLDPDNKVLKNKIKTVSVSNYHEYNEDYLTSLKIILERSRSEYCILRNLIEEEIIKRHAKWRASMLTPPVPKKTDKGITGGQTNPPPTSSSI